MKIFCGRTSIIYRTRASSRLLSLGWFGVCRCCLVIKKKLIHVKKYLLIFNSWSIIWFPRSLSYFLNLSFYYLLEGCWTKSAACFWDGGSNRIFWYVKSLVTCLWVLLLQCSVRVSTWLVIIVYITVKDLICYKITPKSANVVYIFLFCANYFLVPCIWHLA